MGVFEGAAAGRDCGVHFEATAAVHCRGDQCRGEGDFCWVCWNFGARRLCWVMRSSGAMQADFQLSDMLFEAGARLHTPPPMSSDARSDWSPDNDDDDDDEFDESGRGLTVAQAMILRICESPR